MSDFYCMQFIKVFYYQLKYGFEKDHTSFSDVGKGPSILLDESWLSADNFLHRLCKVFSLIKLSSMQCTISMLAFIYNADYSISCLLAFLLYD